MDIPVVRTAFVSALHTLQKTAETPLVTVQFLEVVDMPVMCNDWCQGRDRAVNCGVPQLQCFDRWLMSLFSRSSCSWAWLWRQGERRWLGDLAGVGAHHAGDELM